MVCRTTEERLHLVSDEGTVLRDIVCGVLSGHMTSRCDCPDRVSSRNHGLTSVASTCHHFAILKTQSRSIWGLGLRR